jgi:hypothetical protein
LLDRGEAPIPLARPEAAAHPEQAADGAA